MSRRDSKARRQAYGRRNHEVRERHERTRDAMPGEDAYEGRIRPNLVELDDMAVDAWLDEATDQEGRP